jgi:integrase
MEHVAAFLAHLRRRGMSTATIRARHRTLSLAERTLPEGLLGADLEQLREWLGAYPSPQTRATYRSALRSFYAWAELDPNPAAGLEAVRVPPRAPRPISDTDLARVLRWTRDPLVRVWVLLEAYGGLRSCEVAATGPQYLDGQRLYLPKVKGGGDGWAALPAHVASAVAGADPWDATPDRVRVAIARALERAGVDATPHQLRHWCGTNTLRATGNLRTVQRVLRHTSIASTAIYTLVTDDEVLAAVEGLPRLSAS